MNSRKTLQKCRKIMTLFDNKKQNSANTSINISKNINKDSKKNFTQKDKKPSLLTNRSKMNNSSMSLKSVKNSPSSHKSLGKDLTKHQNIYNRQSRYQKIMKLQVKPRTAKKLDPRSSYLQSSRVSQASISSAGKTSIKKESRFDKIMKLKISKPSAQSTLKNYQPVKREKMMSSDKENNDYNSVIEMKRCKDIIKKEQRQTEKEDRLWKVFQRERDLRMKQKNSKSKLSYEREISLQKRFDNLVQKELKRIQNQKELQERKQLGFSPYLFPSY